MTVEIVSSLKAAPNVSNGPRPYDTRILLLNDKVSFKVTGTTQGLSCHISGMIQRACSMLSSLLCG